MTSVSCVVVGLDNIRPSRGRGERRNGCGREGRPEHVRGGKREVTS